MDGLLQTQLKEMRTLIHEMGWANFMSHLGGLMAEQADKVPDKQSSPLFVASSMMHLPDLWEACGEFKYPDDMINKR